MINYLIPFERIGYFTIGENIDNYVHEFNFKYTPVDDSTGWETYELVDEGISLYTENGKIESIATDQECLYKGMNIIGKTIDEFISFSGLIHEDEVDSLWISEKEKQDIYEFDDIGLQVWCKNDKIVTAIASAYIEDEEE